MNQKLIITNILSVTIAITGTLFAIGCANDSATEPENPVRSIENAPFDRVKVYVPKTDEDQERLYEAASLVIFPEVQLTSEYTYFSHSYQLIADQNGEPQLQEIEVSPEETMEVEHKQTLTFGTTEEGRDKFESQREGIGGHAACYLDEAQATDETEAVKYLLCQGNLLVIEKEVAQEEGDADAEEGADAEESA